MYLLAQVKYILLFVIVLFHYTNPSRDVLVMWFISGRSPSPMKGMRGTANSLDWDHSVDTQVPQGEKMLFLDA